MALPLGRDSEIIAHRYTIQSYFNAGNSVKALNAYLTAYNVGYVGQFPLHITSLIICSLVIFRIG